MAEHDDRKSFVRRRDARINLGGVGGHESVYKYVELDSKKLSWKYFEQMLRESQVIGATLNSLNDPLEGNPRILDDLTEEVYEECCLYFDKDGVQRDERRFEDTLPFSELNDHVRLRLKNTKEQARILAFARRADSHLMWSHYASSHRGACLHFNVAAFDDPELTIGAVSYTLNRPVVPLSLLARIALPPEKEHHPIDRKALRSELYRGLFFTKPSDWSYEEEVRVIYSKSKMTNVPFRRSQLFEIIVGAKCPADDVERINEMVEKHASHIKIRQAQLSDDTFAVGIE